MKDFDEQFKDLVKDLPDPEIAMSLVDVSEAIEVGGDCLTHLSKFITAAIVNGDDIMEIPDNLANLVNAFGYLCVELSDSLHSFLCDEDE